MNEYDLVIKNATTCLSPEAPRVTFGIRDGSIEAVLPYSADAPADRVIDAGGLLAIPGMIDTHTHIRDPARPDREDFLSGTAAAASGGVTTILEMPTSDPPVTSAERLSDRAKAVRRRALVDFGLYAGAGTDNLEQIRALARAGAVAFKTFMTAPAPERLAEFVGMYAATARELYVVLAAVSHTRLLHCLHCEDDEMIGMFSEMLRGTRKDGKYHANIRPTICEDLAVGRVSLMAANLHARVQVVHVSSPRAVELARFARTLETDISLETAPHYLTLSTSELERFGPLAKCNPPLRTRAEIDRLWSLVNSGDIDSVGSDHCPYLATEVRAGAEDIGLTPPGLPGIELSLPLLFTALAAGRTSLEVITRITSSNAARRFGLRNKGSLSAGHDADIVLVDPAEEWTFDHSKALTHARENLTVYDDLKLTGRVISTFVRGRLVYDRGDVCADGGWGNWLPGIDYEPE